MLPAQHIRNRSLQYPPLISPFVGEKTLVSGMSFGLSSASYDIRIAQSLTIKPGEFKLASTLEYFYIHDDLCAVVHDKSSWARRGLAVQNTLFDPGWNGYATLELSNHGKEILAIYAGDPICQIVFHLLVEPTELPYSGKYQNQINQPVPAIEETGMQKS